jgi:hypothetical protein
VWTAPVVTPTKKSNGWKWLLGLAVVAGGGVAYKKSQEKKLQRSNPDDVASTILQQIGGSGRLKMMIGAKDFVGSPDALLFKWVAPSANKANALRIRLMPDDTYEVSFLKIRGGKVSTVRVIDSAYAEDLARIFRTETGLALSL